MSLKRLNNKVIFISGGTGSFGSTLAKKLICTDVGEVRIFSRDEKKQDDLRNELSNQKFKFYIGDVRDFNAVDQAIKGSDYVFHAAALKQVPSCEFFPMEAVKTNIIGTENVIQSCLKNSIKKAVFLSTDKAVYPINAMGMTKALLEKLMIANSRTSSSETVLCGTRYGNVMASRGSVIPLFLSQILNSQELTITDPNMTRFLMSLDDSINLVMHAFDNSEKGDIFIHKAPAGNILNIAKAIAKIVNKELTYKIIGIRHGEKLSETLISNEEMLRSEDHGNFYRIKSDMRDLNYSKYFIEGDNQLQNYCDYNSNNTSQLSVDAIVSLFQQLDIFKKINE